MFCLDISKLSAIKDRLHSNVSYGHIKLVIAILELSCGAAKSTVPAGYNQRPTTGNAPVASSCFAPTSQETARRLPGWLSERPGGKRKNPF